MLAGRLFESAVGAVELCNVYLGTTLGLYRHLADGVGAPEVGLGAGARVVVGVGSGGAV